MSIQLKNSRYIPGHLPEATAKDASPMNSVDHIPTEKEIRKTLYNIKKKDNKRRNTLERRERIRKEVRRKMMVPHTNPEIIVVPHEDLLPLPLHQGNYSPPVEEPVLPGQSFDEFVNECMRIAALLGRSALWESHGVSLLTFCYQMWRADCIADYCFALVAFAKSRDFPLTVINEICGFVRQPVAEPVAEELFPEGFCSNLRDNWKLLINNPVFSKISMLITAAMALPVCQMKTLDFTFCGVQLMTLEASKNQLKCFDIIDAILDTFTWIAETGWKIITTGSLYPVVFSDQRVETFNRLYVEVDSTEISALAGNHPDLPGFRKKLDECIKMASAFQKARPNEIISEYVEARYKKLVLIKEKLTLKDRNTNLRQQPLGYSIFGGTGQGKSIVARLVMNQGLHSMGYSTDRSHQIQLDPADKYHSTYSSDVLGLFIDDLSNTKSTFLNGSATPSALIIKFFNNIAAQAIKAEIHEKGNVFIDFKCGVITTNKRDLDASTYSNCPESILRRLNHITVRVKPQYCVPGGTTLNVAHPDLVGADVTHDVWEFDVNEVISSTNPLTGKGMYAFQPVVMDVLGTRMACTNLNLKQLLDVVRQQAVAHKARQDSLLRANTAFDTMPFCTHHFPMRVCNCGIPESFFYTPSYAETIFQGVCANFMRNFAPSTYFMWMIKWCFGYQNLEQFIVNFITKIAYEKVSDWAFNYTIQYTPHCVLVNPIFQRFFRYTTYYAEWVNAKVWIHRLWLLYIVGYFYPICFLIAPIAQLLLFLNHLRRVKLAREALLARRDTLSLYARDVRDNFGPKLLGSIVLLMGMVKIAQLVYRQKYFGVKPQTADGMEILLPSIDKKENSNSPAAISAQKSWFEPFFALTGQSTPNNGATKTMVTDQAINLVNSNLFFAEFSADNWTTINRCCIFFPRKNVAIFPLHIYYPGSDPSQTPHPDMLVRVTRHDSPGGKFVFSVSYETSQKFDDLAVVYVPSCPDLKNVVKMFPEVAAKGQGWNVLVRKYQDCSLKSENIYTTHCDTGHMYMKFKGCEYTSSLIGKGACMSCVVSKVNPSILGFHIAGNESKGSAIFLSRSKLESMIAALDNSFCVVISTDSTKLPESHLGKEIVVKPLHHMALPHTFTSENYVEIYGQTNNGKHSQSSVEVSLISHLIIELMNVPNKYGPPKMGRGWEHYNRCMTQVSNPSIPFPVTLLHRACRDYLEPVLAKVPEYKIFEGRVAPLSIIEMVSGVRGKRFIEPLNMKTSVGFPVFGPKSKYFEDVLDERGALLHRIPNAEIMEELEKTLACYQRNERAYPIFAACLKDEVKEVTSEKVRVFQAAPIVLSLLVRKYFLPLIRFLHHYPCETEIAVGLNAFGKQWQDLDDYTNQFSPDGKGCFGMDYKAYDTRINAQITRAALWILIEIAKYFDYSEEDICIMKAMVNDITHPTIDFNGVLLQLYNMNPSGNNLTVQINCIANSIYMRMCYYDAGCPPPFKSNVALITYGDDNKCSVRESIRAKYSFMTVKRFLNSHDMEITPPDKVSSPQDFYELENLDFLKRQSFYVEEIGRKIGRLEESSIFKSLHCNSRSKNASREDVISSCIETALHEWFAYGRVHYTMRLEQMRKVCAAANLPLPILEIDFDERVAKWKAKYDVPIETDETRFEDGACHSDDLL